MRRILVLGDRDHDRLTHREVDAALALFPGDIEAGWAGTDSVVARELVGVDGVWLVSGGPYRADDAVFGAVDHCLDSGTPFLGTCSGFQYACIALARRRGIGATHAELDPRAPDPLIAPLACSLYGETRLITPAAGTQLSQICGSEPFPGFHYCGYGLAAQREQVITRAGARISARSGDAGAEAIELPGHPFFLATLFQPQVGASTVGELHPLLRSFLQLTRAALTNATCPAREFDGRANR